MAPDCNAPIYTSNSFEVVHGATEIPPQQSRMMNPTKFTTLYTSSDEVITWGLDGKYDGFWLQLYGADSVTSWVNGFLLHDTMLASTSRAFSWSIPSWLPSGKYKIRVLAVEDATAIAYIPMSFFGPEFTITNNNPASVFSPSMRLRLSNQNWTPKDPLEITWTPAIRTTPTNRFEIEIFNINDNTIAYPIFRAPISESPTTIKLQFTNFITTSLTGGYRARIITTIERGLTVSTVSEVDIIPNAMLTTPATSSAGSKQVVASSLTSAHSAPAFWIALLCMIAFVF